MGAPSRQYAVGDRVRSTRGHAGLVVTEVYDPIYAYRYVCTWTTAGGEVRRAVFTAEQLMPAGPERPPPT